jgi:hypothetical protein
MKVVYAYVTYTLLMMIYTAINVPYGALMGVMTAKSGPTDAPGLLPLCGCQRRDLYGHLAPAAFLVKTIGGGNDQLGYSGRDNSDAMMAGLSLLHYLQDQYGTYPAGGEEARTLQARNEGADPECPLADRDLP